MTMAIVLIDCEYFVYLKAVRGSLLSRIKWRKETRSNESDHQTDVFSTRESALIIASILLGNLKLGNR